MTGILCTNTQSLTPQTSNKLKTHTHCSTNKHNQLSYFGRGDSHEWSVPRVSYLLAPHQLGFCPMFSYRWATSSVRTELIKHTSHLKFMMTVSMLKTINNTSQSHHGLHVSLCHYIHSVTLRSRFLWWLLCPYMVKQEVALTRLTSADHSSLFPTLRF